MRSVRLHRLFAALALFGFASLVVMPTATAAFGNDDACAHGCEGDCEPGCLACTCSDRGVIGEPPSLDRPAPTHEVAPTYVARAGELAERREPPPLRPPRA